MFLKKLLSRLMDRKSFVVKEKYLRDKLGTAADNAYAIDYLIVGIFCYLTTFLPVTSQHYIDIVPAVYQDYISEFNKTIHVTLQNARNFSVLWMGMLVINILLVLSPLRGTIGMRIKGLEIKRPNHEPPKLRQAIGVVVLAPSVISISLLSLVQFFLGYDKLNLYARANAVVVIMFGLYILLSVFYTLRFGSRIQALQSLSGLKIDFSKQKYDLLEKRLNGKNISFLNFLETYLQIKEIFFRIGAYLFLILGLYMSLLVAIDIFSKPLSEEFMYKVYDVNWEENNGFFALEGLNAPPHIENFYEQGRVNTYQSFIQNERIKKAANINSTFPVPRLENFVGIPEKQMTLAFQSLKDTGQQKSLDCIYLMDKRTSEPCMNEQDLETLIANNEVLWKRFNLLPDYTIFQRPPIGGNDRMETSTFLQLVRTKAAYIVFLQEKGKTREALYEWKRFMELYQRIAGLNTNFFRKAVYMQAFSIQKNVLETLLYKSPELALDYFDVIKNTLNMHGISQFRGETLLFDDLSDTEPSLLFLGVGSSPGIRNKTFLCFAHISNISTLSAASFFMQKSNEEICPTLQGSIGHNLFRAAFTTPGNPITNTIYASQVMQANIVKNLIGNMYIQDAYMRMALLGINILNDNVSANDVGRYIQESPKGLWNPIEEKPYYWNEEGRYIYFMAPNNPGYQVKFRLKL